MYDSNGRMSGEAFVQFRSCGEDGAEGALKRNREKIGHRSVESSQQYKNVVDEKLGIIIHIFLSK